MNDFKILIFAKLRKTGGDIDVKFEQMSYATRESAEICYGILANKFRESWNVPVMSIEIIKLYD